MVIEEFLINNTNVYLIKNYRVFIAENDTVLERNIVDTINAIVTSKSVLKLAHSVIKKSILKYALEQTYGICCNDIKLEISKFGKPYLRDYNNIYFNVSHSGDSYVCVVSNRPVGVDIQVVRNFSEEMINKVFNEKEIDIIKASGYKNEKATELWSKKEAALKAQGMGISNILLQDVDIKNVITRKIDNYYLSIQVEEDFCVRK